MTKGSLSPDERETIITMDDGSDAATIYTYQRRVISLLKGRGYVPLNEGTRGATPWAEFTVPASTISFRSSKKERRTRNLSAEERTRRAERMRTYWAKKRKSREKS